MGEYFAPLRALHMASAALSITLFFVRWVWMLAGSRLLANRLVKVLPHVVDTVLLLSALALVSIIGFEANAAWLSAKIAGLVVYVVLGTLALKRARTKGMRAVCGVLAVLTFGFIASVARSHDPYGFLRAWL
jgi:uncharacterized membrane protein SirB2